MRTVESGIYKRVLFTDSHDSDRSTTVIFQVKSIKSRPAIDVNKLEVGKWYWHLNDLSGEVMGPYDTEQDVLDYLQDLRGSEIEEQIEEPEAKLNCPHCGISLDAPPGGCVKWGLNFGHPFTSHLEARVCDENENFKHYLCRECGGTWVWHARGEPK